jgi:hypothetical protein
MDELDGLAMDDPSSSMQELSISMDELDDLAMDEPSSSMEL